MTKLEIKDRIITAMDKLKADMLSSMNNIEQEVDISTLLDIKVKIDLQFIVKAKLTKGPEE